MFMLFRRQERLTNVYENKIPTAKQRESCIDWNVSLHIWDVEQSLVLIWDNTKIHQPAKQDNSKTKRNFIVTSHNRKKTIDASSGVVAGKERGGSNVFLLNFGLSENCRKVIFLSKKFCPKVQNLERKPQFCKFQNQIKILSTHSFLCRKFAVSVGKLEFPAPPTFLNLCAVD